MSDTSDPYTTTDAMKLEAAGNGGCTPTPDPVPDPIPWLPKSGDTVTITNNSGAQQVLSDITHACLKNSQGGAVTSITIEDGETWTGQAGGAKGTYKYQDGSGGLALKTGTIDPS